MGLSVAFRPMTLNSQKAIKCFIFGIIYGFPSLIQYGHERKFWTIQAVWSLKYKVNGICYWLIEILNSISIENNILVFGQIDEFYQYYCH